MIPFAPRQDFDLSALNTMGLAARTAWFAAPTTIQGLRDAFSWARAKNLPCLILGGGSNLILACDWPGLVIQPALIGREYLGIFEGCHRVRVAAGENWHQTVIDCVRQGWPGLENLALIPGHVGAAPIQNIGAYGLEVAERIAAVEVLNPRSGTVENLSAAECHFAYRDSVFKHADGLDWVVTSVEFALPLEWQARTGYRDVAEALGSRRLNASAQEILDAVVEIRQRKLPDPAVLGNAGSFFKNPVVSGARHSELLARHPKLVSYPQADGSHKLAAGWLIDQAGWKGRRLGAAGVHSNQALVLVNHGGATGLQVLALARQIQGDIRARFDVELEIEPRVIESPA